MSVGRPPYTITTGVDFVNARAYIKNAMERGDISQVSGYMTFRNADTAEKLQAWCNDYLDADQFEKLKTAVRVARKRSRDYKRQPRKSVDLSWPAWMALSRLAEERGVTLSEAVLLMEDAYCQVFDAKKTEVTKKPA